MKWGKESETAVVVTATGDPFPLSGEIDVTLLRATQEALANIRKHAAAQSVKITLSYMPDLLMLDIQDDGRGMEVDAASNNDQSGYGLAAMRERISQFNGSLFIESEPNEGTTLTVSIPIVSEMI
jgi:signal transduction histidine kinase